MREFRSVRLDGKGNDIISLDGKGNDLSFMDKPSKANEIFASKDHDPTESMWKFDQRGGPTPRGESPPDDFTWKGSEQFFKGERDVRIPDRDHFKGDSGEDRFEAWPRKKSDTMEMEMVVDHEWPRESEVTFIQIQQSMEQENRQFTMMSNIMKNKHDTAKSAINNIR